MMQSSSSAALVRYRAEVRRVPEMTPAEEQALARRFQAGDRAAARRLVEGCLSAVVAIAVEYRRTGLALDDLVQEGNLGLLAAIERFDPERGVRLSSYAKYWIRAAIRAAVVRSYRAVKLGTTRGEQRALWLYRRSREERPEVLAALTGLTVERATGLLPLLMANDVSLSPPPDGAPGPLDRIADHARIAEDLVGEMEERGALREAVAAILADLSPRDQDVVRRRLMAEEPETLERIGGDWGVTKERVRQLEASLRVRLRSRLEAFAA